MKRFYNNLNFQAVLFKWAESSFAWFIRQEGKNEGFLLSMWHDACYVRKCHGVIWKLSDDACESCGSCTVHGCSKLISLFYLGFFFWWNYSWCRIQSKLDSWMNLINKLINQFNQHFWLWELILMFVCFCWQLEESHQSKYATCVESLSKAVL